ncbi:uncharacterized protein Dana_GF26751 [Drosophila ananassae]|uniref:TGF-beta family profile domain-containing protein n=1 Tax=Drosophila ananassae TaxID=7217 RepID=A0A0N8NZU7_DROAN|nr:uncharacterized protein Dana_GF26751 [Drosophila ananassae]
MTLYNYHIYTDNAPTDYNIYNKYNNNNFYKKTNKQHIISPGDLVRLESIKRQILTKLGLTHKPNVSNPLPKQFIWETIYRADGDRIINNAFESSSSNFRKKSSRLNKNGGKVYATSSQKPIILIFCLNLRMIIHAYHSYNLQKSSGYGRASKSFNDISIERSNANPFSKSTYVININPSSDSSDSIGGKNGEINPNDHEYFNDYSDQSPYKSQDPEWTNRGYYRMDTHIFSSNIDTGKLKRHYGSEINDHENFEQEDFFGNTQEIITFAETGTQYRQYRILEFSLHNRRVPNQNLSIRSAQVHIRIEKPQNYWIAKVNPILHTDNLLFANTKWKQNKPHPKIKIWIFQLTEGINITEKGIDHSIKFRASFEVNTKRLGWKKFDLTETIRDWYTQSNNEKLRLLIGCTGCGDRYSIHSLQSAQLNETRYSNSNRPFLVLHTESLKKRRIRRRAVDCGGALNGQCCKESFYVSFKALGWDDWIIAPRGYFANYCRGDCTGSFRTPDIFQTFHAHFIEEYRKMGLLNGMRPCCAPIKFSSMSLIYYGDDGIIKRDLPKMVIDECGCP